jgi:hypothetical protein
LRGNALNQIFGNLEPPGSDEPDGRTKQADPAPERRFARPDAEKTATGQPPALAASPDILGEFVRDLRRAGVAGEERLGKLLYLALTSRLLPWGTATNRPVSVLIRGTTSTGKSHTMSTTIRFFPDDAIVNLGSMSRRFLFYDEESYSHRVLVIPEAAQVIGDDESLALIRTLLSEGRVVHGTVSSDGKQKGRRIIKEGPTALLMSTTKAYLDEELETRMLSLRTDDTPEQTRRVFQVYAELENGDSATLDFGRWHRLQTWLAEHGENRTHVPFVDELARLMPTGSTRLRRDFVSMLCLIRAHTVLHQQSRARDAQGRLLATVADYAAVRDLIGELVAEGVDAAVSDAVRETVEAVRHLLTDGREFVTPKQVEAALKVGRSATYDRIKAALKGGWLADETKKDERGMKLKTGTPLPGGTDYLPAVADVIQFASGNPPDTVAPHDDAEASVTSGRPDRPARIPAPPLPGQPGYPLLIAIALRDGHITDREHDALAATHRRRWPLEVVHGA